MKAPTSAEWRALLRHLHRNKRDPFDGRRADMLLGIGFYLSTTARGSKVSLRLTREAYGERVVRRYVSVFVGADLLEMVVKPTRAKDGRPGRVAVYEFRWGAESLPTSSTETGSENYDQSGQRLCSTEVDDDDPDSCSSLPTSTLKASCLSTSSAAAESVTFTLDVRRLVSLASLSRDAAAWQVVASMMPMARAS